MNTKKSGNRGMGMYFALLLVLLLAAIYISTNNSGPSTYVTEKDMENALEQGEVVGAEITPSQTPPTGSVTLIIRNGDKGGQSKVTFYVTDIAKTQATLEEKGIYPIVHEAAGDNWFLTGVLPILVGAVADVGMRMKTGGRSFRILSITVCGASSWGVCRCDAG